MPYIDQEQRRDVRNPVNRLIMELRDGEHGRNGMLNYIVTELCVGMEPSCYDEYNDLIGVLECVKLELYRRMVVPYEEKKRCDNGDVYD